MIPVFNSIWGITKRQEKEYLSEDAKKVLKVLRKEWEMATADLRIETKLDRAAVTKAIDELQKKMKVIPQEVVYVPKFTYIWTPSEARFPDEMSVKITRDEAVRELARCYLKMCGMTLLGDMSRTFGFFRWESGRANHQLVDKRFAERLATGVYLLTTMEY